MSLRVVGAGLGRTGTHTLKVVLERLLGGPCHHMVEVFAHPEQVARWQLAVDGAPYEEWGPVLDGYAAAVDWPSCRFFDQLVAAHPDALVLLSVRADADEWWRSADATIFAGLRTAAGPDAPDPWGRWAHHLIAGHIGSYADAAVAKAGYERHNQAVRGAVPTDRLLEWRATDGWEPICDALGVSVPDEPFPVTNTTEEWLGRQGSGA